MRTILAIIVMGASIIHAADRSVEENANWVANNRRLNEAAVNLISVHKSWYKLKSDPTGKAMKDEVLRNMDRMSEIAAYKRAHPRPDLGIEANMPAINKDRELDDELKALSFKTQDLISLHAGRCRDPEGAMRWISKAVANYNEVRGRNLDLEIANEYKPTVQAADNIAKNPDAAPADAVSAAAPAAQAEPPKHEEAHEVKLKDGNTVKAVKVVDGGDVYSIKTSAGKFVTVKKDDVVEIPEALLPKK